MGMSIRAVQATLNVRAWIRNRRDRGLSELTSNALWDKINKDYAPFTKDEKEYVFQFCEPGPGRISERFTAG